MFTGIIEKTVRVIGVSYAKVFRRLTLASNWTDVRLGESVAVNGVCLTVAEIMPGELGFDIILETLEKTALGRLQAGDEVHVERALRLSDRLDGHFVQGHVDGIARLVNQIDDDEQCRLRLSTSAELAKYLTPKGSVTLDGVSLTIAAVAGNEFEVALIPTTLQLTTLSRRAVGAEYNLECDVLAKTVIYWLERQRGTSDDIRAREQM